MTGRYKLNCPENLLRRGGETSPATCIAGPTGSTRPAACVVRRTLREVREKMQHTVPLCPRPPLLVTSHPGFPWPHTQDWTRPTQERHAALLFRPSAATRDSSGKQLHNKLPEQARGGRVGTEPPRQRLSVRPPGGQRASGPADLPTPVSQAAAALCVTPDRQKVRPRGLSSSSGSGHVVCVLQKHWQRDFWILKHSSLFS